MTAVYGALLVVILGVFFMVPLSVYCIDWWAQRWEDVVAPEPTEKG